MDDKLTASIYSPSGEIVGTMDLDPSVFGADINIPLMHQSVERTLANARQGTVGVKTRAQVARTTAKLFRQKGTGRARQGSRSGPHWTGGGVAFGPQARDYSKAMPVKMRQQAVRSALSAKLADDEIRIIDGLSIDPPKTKQMAAVLQNLKVEGHSILLVLAENSAPTVKASRNIPRVDALPPASLCVREILGHQRLLIAKDAVQKITNALSTQSVIGE